MKLAAKIEEMAYEAEMLRSMVMATYDAIYNGCNDYKEFDGQLNMVFYVAHDHMKHMKALMDEAYALQRQKKSKSEGVKNGVLIDN